MHNYNTTSHINFKSLCILGTEQWSGQIFIRLLPTTCPPARPTILMMTMPLAAKG